MKRESGILLPITSLPSRYGIGCFSKEAYEFVDQLKAAGQSYWQILPLGPTSYGDSPYQSFSTFAGNPYFISLERLQEEGVLTEEECEEADFGSRADSIDYAKIYKGRYPLLRKAYERSNISENPDFCRFREENGWWLKDYALYMAVKARFEQKAWYEWAEDIRLRWDNAMDYYRRELYFDIEFHEYLQFKFMEQWTELKAYANSQGIRIVGDIPIYVAMDSADAWANPFLFQLDGESKPVAVAGCPPDGFSATGQLWGNPLYNWEYHRQTGYGWWISRLAHCYRLYDVVRIDHFRGFESYYSIPARDTTAQNGSWQPGPGMDFIGAIHAAMPGARIIAEDLGYLTPQVKELLEGSGYPGMKVLQFAFDRREAGDYLPHNYLHNSVVYTGTHDNTTTAAWETEAHPEDVERARAYLHAADEPLVESFIRAAMASVSNTAIVPMQDWLGLGGEARMNVPSRPWGNWQWRVEQSAFTPQLAGRIAALTELYGR